MDTSTQTILVLRLWESTVDVILMYIKWMTWMAMEKSVEWTGLNKTKPGLRCVHNSKRRSLQYVEHTVYRGFCDDWKVPLKYYEIKYTLP